MANTQRDQSKQRFWRHHVAAWRRSGQGIRGYCRTAGLSEPSFYAWRRVLAERRPVRGSRSVRKKSEPEELAAPTFLPVRLIEEPSAAGSVEVVLRGGRVVRVAAGFAAATLREVVAVLEGLPC